MDESNTTKYAGKLAFFLQLMVGALASFSITPIFFNYSGVLCFPNKIHSHSFQSSAWVWKSDNRFDFRI